MNQVKWSQAHLQELEKNFPELLDTSNTNELILNTGKRTVVNYVKNKILHQEKKLDGKVNQPQ